MMRARFPFVLSVALLAEYRRVLLRDRIRAAHGLDGNDIDTILTMIASNAIVREPGSAAEEAPDSGDQHLWGLLSISPDAVLVTGDRTLMDGAPDTERVVSPREFLG